MFNNKAQESAPFELIVAVIVMGFVILFGMNAINELRKQQCSKDLDSILSKIKISFENVINQRSPQRISVKFPDCYNNTKLSLRIEDRTALCSSYCQKQVNKCVLLKFDSKNNTELKCVNINPLTNFVSQNETGLNCIDRSNERPKYVLIDPSNEIAKGFYVIYNGTPISQVTPVVCMYKQGVN